MTSSLSCCGCWPLRRSKRRPSSTRSPRTWRSVAWRPSLLTTSLNGRCHLLSTGFFSLTFLFFSHLLYVLLPLHPQQNSGFTRYSLRNSAYLFTIWTALFTCSHADNTFLFAQESSDEVPDVVPTHVLLQTCRKAAVQRLDQQQRLQAVLFTLSQMVSLCENSLVWTWERGDIYFHTTQTAVCRFAAAFALRQRMLNFVQNIQYYMMFEVMEPNWHIMENNLKTVS